MIYDLYAGGSLTSIQKKRGIETFLVVAALVGPYGDVVVFKKEQRYASLILWKLFSREFIGCSFGRCYK